MRGGWGSVLYDKSFGIGVADCLTSDLERRGEGDALLAGEWRGSRCGLGCGT